VDAFKSGAADLAISRCLDGLGMPNARYVLIVRTDEFKAIAVNTDDAGQMLAEALTVVEATEHTAGHA
jgi:hypothetical protein